MKRFFLTLIASVLALSAVAQKESCSIVADNYSELQLKIAPPAVEMLQASLLGNPFTALRMEGYLPSSKPGAPELPLFSALIEVPLCVGFDVKVSEARYDTLLLEGAAVMPHQPSRMKNDTTAPKLVMDAKLYATEAFLGDEEATVEAVGVARDRNLARLQFAPVHYNPVSRQLIICRQATITVTYREADEKGSKELFERYHSPAFANSTQVLNNLYPKGSHTDVPLRYLIVANSMFRGQMDEFVNWKRRKGFLTDIVYTDEPSVGTTTTSIAAYIKHQYTQASNDNPAPSYVLLVGDVEQIPAFEGITDEDHVTDLYYMTWTEGDHIPDCHYGRFSAKNVSQLTPQIEKTLMYEQYTFADPTFLDRAVLVAGVDGGEEGDYGYTHGDPTMDYAATNYINSSRGFTQVEYFKNDATRVPNAPGVVVRGNTGTMVDTIRAYYNQGAGFINYTAHGGSTSWANPNFSTTHVATMSNVQKFGIMIGNCCVSNRFEESECLGESLLRKGNYCGAVGYIGASDNTYWYHDVYWSMGARSNISATMSLAYDAQHRGVFDCLNHTHGESFSDWAPTQGSMVMKGDMAVEGSAAGDNEKYYYWEIYHLMGDPSVMPYLTQAAVIPLTAPASIVYGTNSLAVTTAPYAYVALTDTADHTLYAAGYADAAGQITLELPSNIPYTGCELVAWAQQYRPAFQNVNMIMPAGAFPVVNEINPFAAFNAGTTVPFSFTVINSGTAAAENITVSFTSSNPRLTFTEATSQLEYLAAGASQDVEGISFHVDSYAEDQETAVVFVTVHWDGTDLYTSNRFNVVLNAPVLTMTFSDQEMNILPGGEATLTVRVRNSGHCALQNGHLTLTSGTDDLEVTELGGEVFTLAAGGTANRVFHLSVTQDAVAGSLVNMQLQLSDTVPMMDSTFRVFIGEAYCETFEGNTFHIDDWQQGTHPWFLTNSTSWEGQYCARSAVNLSHSDSSVMSITRTVTRVGDSIVFYLKVSSERNYDKFFFRIDGVTRATFSGEINWQRMVFPVSQGLHTFTFAYVKDHSVSGGDDCAWVDFVIMPDAPVVDSSRMLPQDRLYETFEDNSYHLTSWTQGTYPWEITDSISHEGFYCLRSAHNLAHGTTSEMSFTQRVTRPGDSIIFYLKVSSERNYDKFFFKIDGNERVSCSGNLDWTRVALPVSVGNHTFLFQYTKDGSVSSGYDCAWVDLISLPDTSSTTPVGIDPVASDSDLITVYPNPTLGQVNLSREVEEVTLYDLTGKMLLTKHHALAVDLSTFPQGVYLLRLTTSVGSTVHRVVKQ